MKIDPQTLRRVAGHFATGVTVVAAERDGQVCALTLNAFASLSLVPPQVIVCVDRVSRTLPCVEQAGRFGVSVLAEGQEEISRQLATKEDAKLGAVRWRRGVTGVPLVEGAHAHLECGLAARYDGGDHVILIGAVQAAATGEGSPLVFYRGTYTGVREPPSR